MKGRFTLKIKPNNFINHSPDSYVSAYEIIQHRLLNLLDSPVIKTYHIGSTAIKGAYTSGIIDILVIVNRLHEITTLDEKRLNLSGFYRLHHPYKKKCVFSQFDSLKTLNEQIRLHIVEKDSKKQFQYLEGHRYLLDHIEEYNHFKQNIDTHLNLKQYEDEKSSWFRQRLSV